jgi:O-acetyl-ADP-ribose deacetylase (regulator of RNase III)
MSGPGPTARGPTIEVVLGDIIEQQVDAIVNAANSTLLGGGGVDGAIHRAGGPEILEECKRIRRERYPDGLPTGEAVATTAGRLAAGWVIHTVGPVYSRSTDPAHLLATCHTRSLRVADEIGAKSVAFPAISTGAFGYPVEEAAPTAVKAVREANTQVGVFASPARTRVVWAGLADPDGRFGAIARRLDAKLEDYFVPEKRELTPHLTLARINPPRDIREFAPELVGLSVASREFPVDDLVLYRSHLSPKGATYEVLERFPLGS